MTEEGRKIFKEYYDNFVKEYDRSPNIEEAFFDGNKILVEQAKEIIKKLKTLYFSPIVTKDDVKRQDEILNEAEQFLKGLAE